MRALVIILVILFCASLFLGCGKAPTGETDYSQLRQQMEAGENPPPQVPAENEREQPQSQSQQEEGGGDGMGM